MKLLLTKCNLWFVNYSDGSHGLTSDSRGCEGVDLVPRGTVAKIVSITASGVVYCVEFEGRVVAFGKSFINQFLIEDPSALDIINFRLSNAKL